MWKIATFLCVIEGLEENVRENDGYRLFFFKFYLFIARGKSFFRTRKPVQYVFVIAWVFDFRKFITITDVSLQAMYIACAPIASLCSQDGLIHERRTKYLVPWM